MARLPQQFFLQDALDLAPLLLGKTLVRRFDSGEIFKDDISDIEVYRGEEDLACHASKGRTLRTEIMYAPGGVAYVYLIYGMYWLLNIVTGDQHHPQAILIRGLTSITGPGRIGRQLALDKSFNGESFIESSRLWLEDAPIVPASKVITAPRVGINYAKDWIDKPWRFIRVD
ncbi:MAG: DNA-3-methyladenine glycosylase [Methylophilus sp.]|jgi:DNA-3-methyladenine glycosylase